MLSIRRLLQSGFLLMFLGIGTGPALASQAASQPALNDALSSFTELTSATQTADYPAFRAEVLRQVTNPQGPTTPTQFMFLVGAMMNDRELVAELARRGRIDVPGPPHGDSALGMAVLDGQTTATRILLEAGANPNQISPYSGSPILLDAVNMENIEILRLLLDHKADPNQAHIEFHMRPLHSAVIEGPADMLKLLLQYKADPNAPDAKGVTPLHLAVSLQRTECVKILLAHGANPNQASQAGTTPLIIARRRPNPEIEKLLIDAGAVEPK